MVECTLSDLYKSVLICLRSVTQKLRILYVWGPVQGGKGRTEQRQVR